MEKNEKIQMLLDMQEHPENYSEQELKTMLKDPEVRELMEATALLKQAMIWENSRKSTVNVDAEWQRFTGQHIADSKPRRGWMKVAAVFLGVLFVSGITFATIHIIRHVSNVGIESQPPIQETTNANPHQLPADTIKKDTIPSKVVRYDEATLEKILTDMADYYGLTLKWKNEEAKTLRLFYIWNKQQSAVEAIRSMNSFERIRLELCDSILTADLQASSPKQ